jgi:pyruvate, orthophosphate dikinase
MILAESLDDRQAALKKVIQYQIHDFQQLFRVLNGRPATIRLLDPPLHEFLPHEHSQMADLAQKMNSKVEDIRRRVTELREANPMLGHRGCRLGISFPEITEMQVRAIFVAALKVETEGIKVRPEVMVPLVGFWQELEDQVAIVHRVAAEVMKEQGRRIKYQVGTMIEVPRGAITADEVAQHAEFFSFGTNDLTQMTLGMSRDDSGTFLPRYIEKGIVKANPFASIDPSGVGMLVKMAVEKGRQARPDLKLGICGEHGGDPKSIEFCHEVGLDYVSCSPYRVPIARLAAAQAAIRSPKKGPAAAGKGKPKAAKAKKR